MRPSSSKRVEAAQWGTARRTRARSSPSPHERRPSRRKIRRQLQSLGFSKSDEGNLEIDRADKEVVRRLHGPHRVDRLSSNADFLAYRAPRLLQSLRVGTRHQSGFDPAQTRAGVRGNLAGGFVSVGRAHLVRARLQRIRPTSPVCHLGHTQREALGPDRNRRSGLQSLGPRHA